jgi:hypothetical protein
MRITLCGSRKFEHRFHEWNRKLTLAGHVVYGLAIYGTRDEGGDSLTEEHETILDQVHFAKIDNSDAIVVLNEDGYYGQSTKNEIRWARIKGKKVFWSMPHMPNIPIDDAWAGVL